MQVWQVYEQNAILLKHTIIMFFVEPIYQTSFKRNSYD